MDDNDTAVEISSISQCKKVLDELLLGSVGMANPQTSGKGLVCASLSFFVM